MNDRIRYELQGKLSYADTGTGGLADATFIEIREPTGLMLIDAGPIRQALVRAFQENEDRELERASRLRRALFGDEETEPVELVNPDDDDEQEPTPPPAAELVDPTKPTIEPITMLAILSMSSVDLPAFYRDARLFLLKPGVAFVEGSMPMTTKLFDALSLTDAENLIGAFAGGFFGASS